MPAKAKLGVMAELDKLAIVKGSKRQARRQLTKSYGVSEAFCWNLQRSAKSSSPKLGRATVRDNPLALVHFVSKALGKSLPDSEKTLGSESQSGLRPEPGLSQRKPASTSSRAGMCSWTLKTG